MFQCRDCSMTQQKLAPQYLIENGLKCCVKLGYILNYINYNFAFWRCLFVNRPYVPNSLAPIINETTELWHTQNNFQNLFSVANSSDDFLVSLCDYIFIQWKVVFDLKILQIISIIQRKDYKISSTMAFHFNPKTIIPQTIIKKVNNVMTSLSAINTNKPLFDHHKQ